MKLGLVLIAASIIWYIIHVVIYNHYLRKNNPGLFGNVPKKGSGKKRVKGIEIVNTSGQTPAWVMLLGLPPMPLFLLGVAITIVAFIVGLFR
ncbi:MAG: hypothetical protein GY832_37680 [Chloroflexi bacterium]|nr:hypothetical protein [Chloroflexota bacterium]